MKNFKELPLPIIHSDFTMTNQQIEEEVRLAREADNYRRGQLIIEQVEKSISQHNPSKPQGYINASNTDEV